MSEVLSTQLINCDQDFRRSYVWKDHFFRRLPECICVYIYVCMYIYVYIIYIYVCNLCMFSRVYIYTCIYIFLKGKLKLPNEVWHHFPVVFFFPKNQGLTREVEPCQWVCWLRCSMPHPTRPGGLASGYNGGGLSDTWNPIPGIPGSRFWVSKVTII